MPTIFATMCLKFMSPHPPTSLSPPARDPTRSKHPDVPLLSSSSYVVFLVAGIAVQKYAQKLKWHRRGTKDVPKKLLQLKRQGLSGFRC